MFFASFDQHNRFQAVWWCRGDQVKGECAHVSVAEVSTHSSLHELSESDMPGQEPQRAVHRTKLHHQLRVWNILWLWNKQEFSQQVIKPHDNHIIPNVLLSHSSRSRSKFTDATIRQNVPVTWCAEWVSATSEKYVQHGDTDVSGAPLLVLHRVAELPGCLDNAMLPVLWRQHLHCGPAGHNWHTHMHTQSHTVTWHGPWLNISASCMMAWLKLGMDEVNVLCLCI